MRSGKSPRSFLGVMAAVGATLALSTPAGALSPPSHATSTSRHAVVRNSGPIRALATPLYGVTVDNIANLSAIVAGSRALPHMPVTRVYFNVRKPATYYADAVKTLQPVSYVMGELLDSSDSRHISTATYTKRVKSYVSVLGNAVDLWEIGNEVNGNWTGRYATVEAKLTDAYNDVASAGKRTALTLYYNIGCGDGPSELDPVAFSQRYVPAAVRTGLDDVFLSYYDGDCKGIRPSAATWTAYFTRLHSLYPHAQLGFGEIGMDEPATSATLGTAQSLMRYYYALDIALPYYVGGYFWWYYDEDCLPITTKPLGVALRAAFALEAAALSH